MKQKERISALENSLFRVMLSYLSSTSCLPEILHWFLVKQSKILLLFWGKAEGRTTLE